MVIESTAKQRRPEFIRSRSRQPLALDAGLDGGVETDEVQGDAAQQCQVVGDMVAAGTGVVVAKLNVQAILNSWGWVPLKLKFCTTTFHSTPSALNAASTGSE